MSPSNDAGWRATADAATRMQHPEEYWCVGDDGWVQYFWAEQTVSREEYLANVRMNRSPTFRHKE